VEKCESIRCWVTRRLVKRRKGTSLWPRLRLLGILSHVADVGPSSKGSLTPVRGIRSFDLHGIKKQKRHQKTIYCTAAHQKKIQWQVSLWFYDRDTSTPSSFISSPYLSQVTLDLGLFATHQARTTFTESPDCLDLETSALGTASSTIVVDVPGCHVQ
jgi:hypothetical protein